MRAGVFAMVMTSGLANSFLYPSTSFVAFPHGFCARQVPLEVRRGAADHNDDDHTGQNGARALPDLPQEQIENAARNGRAGVDVLAQDVGHIPGEHIAQHAAARAGQQADKHQQQRIRAPGEGDGGVHARDREDAEPGRVHDEHERVEHALAAPDEAPHEREKQHDRHAECDEQIDRVLKRARRGQPHDEIAQDAAADGRRDAQQPHAEDIHMLFDAEHRAADGERDRPGQFKQKEKGFHRHDLRKKSTPLPWCRCVLCPFT